MINLNRLVRPGSHYFPRLVVQKNFYHFKMDANSQPKDVIPSQASNPRMVSSDLTLIPMGQIESKLFPTNYTLSTYRMQVAQRISKLLPEGDHLNAESIWQMLERPKNEAHGHFSLPCPQLKVPGNPVALAADLAARCPRDEVIKGASSVGPFLNITIDGALVLKDVVSEVLEMKEQYGMNDVGRGRRVAVEYCSCNIAKPFHAGHLRTTIIGNFVKLLYRANGFDTFGINYLGDWGKQYGALAVGFERYGDEQKLKESPIRHLYEVYVRIHADMEKDETINERAKEYFLKMEQGVEDNLALWRRFREMSIGQYGPIFKRLNVNFEVYSGESLYSSLMFERLEELRQAGLLTESKGAEIVDLEEFKLGKALLVKSDGATLYLTRDVASCQDRIERWNLDKSIYVVSSQQDLHMQQLSKIVQLAKKPWADRIQHINFGMVKGMSTRKGTVVFLDDILDEARDTMHAVMQSNPTKYAEIEDPLHVSDILGVSAVLIQDMSAKRIKDYDFKMDRMTQFEGDTGPYLQYAHTRLCSIPRKTGCVLVPGESIEYSLLSEKEALELALVIGRYPDVVQEARLQCEPCQVVSYLMSLARQVSTCLDRLYVKDQEEQVAKARLALYTAARITLGNGLRLLGLIPLERM